VNIHSSQWLWLSHAAFIQAGVSVPTDWSEFVAAAPALEQVGIIPLAMGQQGWQQTLAFDTLQIALAGIDTWKQVNVHKNARVAAGPKYAAVFAAAAQARQLARKSRVQDWNLATNLVISDKAGGQIMGDWAQGEFQLAGEVAGKDYSCLPGLGVNAVLDTGGDAFYFPRIDDPRIKAAQLELASILISPKVQLAFNLAKGSLPVRGDIDMSSANECMQKGLKILQTGGVLPSGDMNFTPDTTIQLEELMAEFWSSDMSPAEAQQRYASIIDDAE
jgi:glucose/mannose transport system substrate-binding protein